MQGVVKAALSGFGLEELVAVSGLSKKHADAWASLAHWRKVRRVLHQATAAMLLEVIDQLLCEDSACREVLQRDMVTPDDVAAAEAFHTSTALYFDLDVVSPRVVREGTAIMAAVQRLSESHVSARVLVQDKLFGQLVPYAAYNVLALTGQTHVLDKFMLQLAPALSLTTKLKYQTVFAQYGAVKLILPQDVRDELYIRLPGKLVLCMTASRRGAKPAHNATHVFHDEAQEMGVNRDAKRFCVRPDMDETMRNWPPYAHQTGLLAVLRETACMGRISRCDATEDMETSSGC